MTASGYKTAGLYLLKLVGTTVFLWWALSQIEDKSLLLTHFRQALTSPFWVTIGLLLSGGAILFGALRWHLLLIAQDIRVPFLYTVRLTLYGALFNLVSIGGAAGDAAKILCLIRRRPDKKVEITLSVMVDHLIGFVATSIVFLVFAWGFSTVNEARSVSGQSSFFAATLFLAGGLFFVALNSFLCTPRAMAWCQRTFPRFAAQNWVQSTTKSIDIFRQNWQLSTWSLLTSIALSLAFFLTFYAAIRTLGQGASVPQILSVMPIVDIMASLPISISGLGVRERTFDFLLSQLTGIPTAIAVAASLIGFLFHAFWGLIGGLAFITEPSRTRQKLSSPATVNEHPEEDRKD